MTDSERIDVGDALRGIAKGSSWDGLYKVLCQTFSDEKLRFAALYELQDRLAAREREMVAALQAEQAEQTGLVENVSSEMTRLWDIYRGHAPLPASMTRESALVMYVDLKDQLRKLAKKEGEE